MTSWTSKLIGQNKHEKKGFKKKKHDFLQTVLVFLLSYQ